MWYRAREQARDRLPEVAMRLNAFILLSFGFLPSKEVMAKLNVVSMVVIM